MRTEGPGRNNLFLVIIRILVHYKRLELSVLNIDIVKHPEESAFSYTELY